MRSFFTKIKNKITEYIIVILTALTVIDICRKHYIFLFLDVPFLLLFLYLKFCFKISKRKKENANIK